MGEWLEQYIVFFGELGFFSKLGHDAIMASTRLRSLYKEEWGEEPRRDAPFIEQWLLTYDKERVYFDTVRAEVVPGDGTYCEILRNVGAVSDKTLVITNCDESWAADSVVIAATTGNGQEVLLELRGSQLEGHVSRNFFEELSRSCGSERADLHIVFFEEYFLCMWLTHAQHDALVKRYLWDFAR